MSDAGDPRWVRNKVLAKMLSVSELTVTRWQKNSSMAFPQPSMVNGYPYTDLQEVERWMRERVTRRAPMTSNATAA
jgi:hypothetical protein